MSCLTASVAVATLEGSPPLLPPARPDVGYGDDSVGKASGEPGMRFGDRRALGGRSRSISSSSLLPLSAGLSRAWSDPSGRLGRLEFLLFVAKAFGLDGGLCRFPLE
jgi:hypothetical protein